MRILICGGRNFNDKQLFIRAMKELEEKHGHFSTENTVIIHGAARGADTLGMEYGYSRRFLVKPFHANWERYGKSAGVLRNVEMLEKGEPNLVVAFPSGRDTAHMVRIAKAANVPVEEITG